jgi:hypothetical protein
MSEPNFSKYPKYLFGNLADQQATLEQQSNPQQVRHARPIASLQNLDEATKDEYFHHDIKELCSTDAVDMNSQ